MEVASCNLAVLYREIPVTGLCPSLEGQISSAFSRRTINWKLSGSLPYYVIARRGYAPTWQSASPNAAINSELPLKMQQLRERIATPVCALVRNDMIDGALQRQNKL